MENEIRLFHALTSFLPWVVPEAVLVAAACALFLGGTWRPGRNLWGTTALAALAVAGLFTWVRPVGVLGSRAEALAALYTGPVVLDPLTLYFKVVSLVSGAVLVLFSWEEMPEEHAADYHACLLLLVAGMCLVGGANDLITLFLALELVSIPTYVLLYLPKSDQTAQEAAMKYFLLSVFSSGLLLFGFSYLYGLAGTTNLPALAEALGRAREDRTLPGVALVAMVMVVAGLGFRITAVPFHFYAPDVYEGATTGLAALLSIVPKVAGFGALLRVFAYVPHVLATPGATDLAGRVGSTQALGDQLPVVLWIMAAVTMSLGNVLALLQDNVKRMLAYSSVAHAGYMLVGLAVAPRLEGTASLGGVEAVLFYLVAYGAMTVGFFAVLAMVSTPGRSVERVRDLEGLSRSHPRAALVMTLFLLSLIGIPLTAGFLGKVFLIWGALGAPPGPEQAGTLEVWPFHFLAQMFQVWPFRVLAVLMMLNAAVGGWYYLRLVAAMYLLDPVEELPPSRPRPVRAAVWVCAFLTLGLGLYPEPLREVVKTAAGVPRESATADTNEAWAVSRSQPFDATTSPGRASRP